MNAKLPDGTRPARKAALGLERQASAATAKGGELTANPKHRTGVIDVGGGMRGIYASGVLDRCLDEHVDFDVAIGISAGSANIASYLARQWGRNFRSYSDYAFRKEYMGLARFLQTGSYIDLDYVYSTISNSNGEDPLDYDTMAQTGTDWRVIAENALTGESRYFGPEDISRDNYDIFKASCAIPGVCKPYEIDGVPYFDGALGDTIPLQAAFDMGCTKVVLILTRPVDAVRSPKSDIKMAQLIKRKYPKSYERLRTRAERYNEGVALARALQDDGHVLIVAPHDTFGVDTLHKEREAMEKLYLEGYFDGERIGRFLSA